MLIQHTSDITYLTIPSFTATGLVKHCFTARPLNLRKNLRQNFEPVCNTLKIDSSRLVFSNQLHGDKYRMATETDAGMAILEECDSLITKTPNLPICTFYADCVPLFFLDPVQKIIALTHSGWRSTLAEIGRKTVERLISLGSCADDILAGIGPSIGPCHFEVENDVADKFSTLFGSTIRNQISETKAYIDLWTICATQLIQAGVSEKNITLANRCTYCEEELFHSFRRDGAPTGHMVAIMQLEEN